jgi:hypothetical protein
MGLSQRRAPYCAGYRFGPRQDRSGIRNEQDLKAAASWRSIGPMLQVIGRRVCTAIRNAARRAPCVLRSVTRPAPLVAGLLGDLVRSRTELVAENALLRQQLIVAARAMTRPAFRPHERGLLVLLARWCAHGRNGAPAAALSPLSRAFLLRPSR